MLKTFDKQIDISNKIIADLMDFTRIRPPEPSPFNLNELVNASLADVTVPDTITVIKNFNEKAPRATADANQIQRVLINLITIAHPGL
jgi:nitrogen fixation/metabolism regulation signal transduction histidine kinase